MSRVGERLDPAGAQSRWTTRSLSTRSLTAGAFGAGRRAMRPPLVVAGRTTPENAHFSDHYSNRSIYPFLTPSTTADRKGARTRFASFDRQKSNAIPHPSVVGKLRPPVGRTHRIALPSITERLLSVEKAATAADTRQLEFLARCEQISLCVFFQNDRSAASGSSSGSIGALAGRTGQQAVFSHLLDTPNRYAQNSRRGFGNSARAHRAVLGERLE